MRWLLVGTLLAFSPIAHAEQTVQQQVDSATAVVSRIMANMGQRIMEDEAEIADLRKQLSGKNKPADQAPSPAQ